MRDVVVFLLLIESDSARSIRKAVNANECVVMDARSGVLNVHFDTAYTFASGDVVTMELSVVNNAGATSSAVTSSVYDDTPPECSPLRYNSLGTANTGVLPRANSPSEAPIALVALDVDCYDAESGLRPTALVMVGSGPLTDVTVQSFTMPDFTTLYAPNVSFALGQGEGLAPGHGAANVCRLRYYHSIRAAI